MSCPNLVEVYAYLEQELSAEDRLRLEEHLKACPGCQRLLADRRLYLESISSLPQPELPSDFTERVMASLPSLRSPARFWLGLTGGLYLLFSLLVMGLALGVRTALFPFCLRIFKSLFNLAADLSSLVIKLIQQAYGFIKALRILTEVAAGLLADAFPAAGPGLLALVLALAAGLALFWSLLRTAKLSERRR